MYPQKTEQAAFYLAAKYDKRQQLLPIAALLMMQGHKVQADWLTGSHEPGSHMQRVIDDDMRWATKDFEDIDACTHFVLFNLPEDKPEPSPGRHIEFGYALARGKICYVVGGMDQCVFYGKANQLATVDDFLAIFAPQSILK